MYNFPKFIFTAICHFTLALVWERSKLGRDLIDSIFGVPDSYFLPGTIVFQRNLWNLHCEIHIFSNKRLCDSCFKKSSENPLKVRPLLGKTWFLWQLIHINIWWSTISWVALYFRFYRNKQLKKQFEVGYFPLIIKFVAGVVWLCVLDL